MVQGAAVAAGYVASLDAQDETVWCKREGVGAAPARSSATRRTAGKPFAGPFESLEGGQAKIRMW